MLDLVRWPVALVQGVGLRLTVPQLDPPKGRTQGVCGNPDSTQVLRLLALGESTVAGCGAATAEQTLTVQVARSLLQSSSRRNTIPGREIGQVHWQAIGEYGARARDCIRWMASNNGLEHDVALLVLGVNDTLRLTARRRWWQEVTELVGILGRKGQARVLLAGVPPMGMFPALRGPIRTLLERRSTLLDQDLARIADGDQVIHAPMPALLDIEPDPNRLFAEDRFHPSALGYRYWGEGLVAALNAALNAAPHTAQETAPGHRQPTSTPSLRPGLE